MSLWIEQSRVAAGSGTPWTEAGTFDAVFCTPDINEAGANCSIAGRRADEVVDGTSGWFIWNDDTPVSATGEEWQHKFSHIPLSELLLRARWGIIEYLGLPRGYGFKTLPNGQSGWLSPDMMPAW